MTREYLLTLQAKLQSAVAFGVQSKGNLDWAKAKLAVVNARLAQLEHNVKRNP